ncbi:phosphoribosylglycinamide formyltransferase [Salisaeta longa]|uniref:phosphoribosylglycinamide formyltransferase n=1 Tax=Salisaeta longa TaxID=503170 RepID=UPI00048DE9FD|nr:phosphoribosylglycinamide formyltransferase [Salisaeta longa]
MSAADFRLAVFASGGGTNFQAILDAMAAGDLPATPALCLSDRDTAGALDRARAHDVPTAVCTPDAYDTPAAYGAALLQTLATHDVTFVALAGFLRKIPPNVVAAYAGRMTNIHPSLLPAFGGRGMYGMRVHRAVVDYGVHWTGATVHLVDDAYDQGPIVLQEPVPVRPGDAPDDVAARVLAVEHRLYPRALRLFAQGRIAVDGRTVRIDDPSSR